VEDMQTVGTTIPVFDNILLEKWQISSNVHAIIHIQPTFSYSIF
jgi:hypothetical protein